MRKKIKELLHKEEGFTLVELLAVIVILGIIVAIAIPAIGSVIDSAQEDADVTEGSLVEDAARLYVTSKQPDIDGDSLELGADFLIEQGYLENRATGDIGGSVTVTVDDNGIYSYEYSDTGTSTAGPTVPAT